VRPGPAGKVRNGIYAVGEVVGTPLDPNAVAHEARVVADSV
jgi:pyruvate/2-oxoglutarate dehydrogenase complex dihydrolipoamide dehydrogenase (E3) component